MNQRFFLKLFSIGVLALLLLIPLLMIGGTISERQDYRTRVVQDIARSFSSAQTLNGPVLVIPYRVAHRDVVADVNGKRERRWETRRLTILPTQLNVTGQMQADVRHRGIYAAQVYQTALTATGSFNLPAELVTDSDNDGLEIGPAYLAVGITDTRGVVSTPELEWSGQRLTFLPGSNLQAIGNGIHAELGSVKPGLAQIPFKLKLVLNGMDSLNVVPLGRQTEVRLSSTWRHPSFIGQYLPDGKIINKDGYQATWRTSWFSTNASERFDQCMQNKCEAFNGTTLGVRLVEPVDIYLMSARSIKYGFLFVFLTFGAFFLFEALTRLAVHPVQYGMVGLGLALFFLLEVSLSEHLPFALAYLIASVACVGLIGYYTASILKRVGRGLGFSAMLSTLYGLLYILLQSEDYALLLGSLLMFALLTLAMVLTRKLDWYQLTNNPAGFVKRDTLTEPDTDEF